MILGVFYKSHFRRHSGESRNPDAVPAKAGNQKYMNLDSCFHRKPWIPAFAGMTNFMEFRLFTNSSFLLKIKNKKEEGRDDWEANTDGEGHGPRFRKNGDHPHG